MDFISSIPWELIAWSLGKTIFLIFIVVLPMVSYTVYAERRVSALIQDRLGPNRTGMPLTLLGLKKDWQPFSLGGLGQPIADAMKFLLKEDFVPRNVNTIYFWMAPCLAMMPALITLAAIPFGSEFLGHKMVVADINVGLLFMFAISSIGVFGIVLAGWSSNSKYPFLGSIRSTSQMISYELSMGLSAVPVLLICGSTSLGHIVDYQGQHGWLIAPFMGAWPTGREILLWIPIMIAGSALIVVLFFGGWHLPGLPDGAGQGGLEFLHAIPACIWGLVNIGVFLGKVVLLLFIFIWVRWTLPRFRYDQLMKLGWLYLFEIALVNIFITAGILAFTK
jgi:NADH-quinone oxidoreductase subunit H